MDNIDYLPIWKEGATASERLQELAMIARKHPERFSSMVIVYNEQYPEPSRGFKTRTHWFQCDIHRALGLLEMGKRDLLDMSLGKSPP